MEPFIGQIIMFAGTFAPRGWALCDGQLLPIASNNALFSILGTTYGGDGKTTFALPDLRGRVPLHPGHGPGLTIRTLGEKNGEESVTLTVNQIPSHGHGVNATSEAPTSTDPTDAFLAGANTYSSAIRSTNAKLDSGSLENTGGSQSHDNMQPYLGVNFIIALVGLFPSRS